MKEIQITRTFLKKPLANASILLGIIMLLETTQWLLAYEQKIKIVQKRGDILYYLLDYTISMFFPELVTLFITLGFVNYYHKLRKITTIECNWVSISYYELQFLPILLLAFPFYNFFTQTVRYLIESLLHNYNYSWHSYWDSYILYTYSWDTYFMYLFPVLLLNYLSINISLIQDYIRQRQALVPNEALEELNQTTSSATTPAHPFLTSLKGKNALGELALPVHDIYFFTIQERTYYAQLDKGQYAITKTLNELEAELDPNQFFRIKRDYIVNRRAIVDYAHWENGKYIVRLNAPILPQVVIPKLRMQELREWLNHSDITQLPHMRS